MRIAHVSTFPPLKCGIAFFASDLIGALPDVANERYALHYGEGRSPGVQGDADVNNRQEVAALAHSISRSGCDVVAVQHEFGIWGGALGGHLLQFLANLAKPRVAIFHPTFEPNERPADPRQLLHH